VKPTRPYAAFLAAAALAVGAWLAFQGVGAVEKLPDAGYTLLDGTRSTTSALCGKLVVVNFRALTARPALR